MKKIKALLLLAVLSLALMACDGLLTPDYMKMDRLDEPVELTVAMNLWGSDATEVMATHSYRLNDEQTLYYVPESVRIDEDVYLNDISGYFIHDEDPPLMTSAWSEATQSQLNEIFKDVE